MKPATFRSLHHASFADLEICQRTSLGRLLHQGAALLCGLLAAPLLLTAATAFAADERPVEDASKVGLESKKNAILPTLWIIGDSTVRVGTKGQRGWGDELAPFFDSAKLNLVNRAIGGRSSRTFLTDGRWDDILKELRAGDVVLMQFGHNDAGPLNEPPPVTSATRARGTIKGNGEETQEVDNVLTGKHEVVHSFGWYLRHYIATAKEKGAIPVVCSPIPHKSWTPDGKVNRASGSYGGWAREAAAQGGALFIDLNEIIARGYEQLGAPAVESFFADKGTHTTVEGARFNARCVVSGLNGLGDKNPVGSFLSAEGKAVPAFPAAVGASASLHADSEGVAYEEISVQAPFAMPAIKIPVFPKRDFPITDFGAKPGEESDNTAAIRKAIAACHDSGGGRVVVPAGEWLTGAVHLQSNVNLYLAKDAVLSFSDDPKDYLPAVESSWEGWECFNYSPLVYAFQCENIALTGQGQLKARVDKTWKAWSVRPPAHMEALKKLYTMGSANVPVEQRQMAEGENNLRPQFIQFNRCRNVLIENVKIRNSPFWTIHLLLCDGAVVRRVDISAHGHNNDGIDPEMTRNLLIEDCRFDQGDDAIAIKSGTNHDGWRLNTPTENVVIRNCTVLSGHQLVAIGSELSGGIRDIYVHDCRFENQPQNKPQNILFIKTNIRRGGFVENITVENIEARSTKVGVLSIDTDVLYQWRKLVPTYEERRTKIRGISFRNVKVGESGTPFRILGDKQEPVRDVTIDNVAIGFVRGQKERYENVENVKATNIQIGTLFEEPDKDDKDK